MTYTVHLMIYINTTPSVDEILGESKGFRIPNSCRYRVWKRIYVSFSAFYAKWERYVKGGAPGTDKVF